MVGLAWGDVWWGESPRGKARPYLVLTRDEAIGVLSRVLVAPVTSTVRGIPSEVPLGSPEGLPIDCVASMDNVTPIRKAYLVRRMGALAVARRRELCAALAAAVGC